MDKDATLLIQRVEESNRLSKFFTKLFSEVQHLQADTVVFRLDKDGLFASLRQSRSEVKSITIKSAWFEPIHRWLADRSWPVSHSETLSGLTQTALPTHFSAAVRVAEQIVLFGGRREDLVGGSQNLSLVQIEFVPLPLAIERLGFIDFAQTNCLELMKRTKGVLLVSAPERENLKRTRACLLSLSGAAYAGSLNDISIRAFVTEYSQKELLVVGVQSADALDALLKFKEYGYDFNQVLVAGSLCQGFVKRNCPNCTREAAVDALLVEVLPPAIRPPIAASYRIGRGCPQCDLTGYLGYIGVQSLLVMDPGLREMLLAETGQMALLRHLYPLGLRSLLEDGTKKVIRGLTTFEALYGLTRVMPHAYLKVIDQLKNKPAAPPPVAVSEDFFKGSDGATPKPLTGRAAFEAAAAEGIEGDKPLFSVGPSRKARAKPLLLVVEDDPDQRNILEMLFKAAGYDVALSGNGVEALSFLNKELPDLVITDLMMPQMDGAELVSKLRANPAFSDIPILILTVVADGEREFTLLDLGADDYCEKTVQRKILLKRIEKLLKRAVKG